MCVWGGDIEPMIYTFMTRSLYRPKKHRGQPLYDYTDFHISPPCFSAVCIIVPQFGHACSLDLLSSARCGASCCWTVPYCTVPYKSKPTGAIYCACCSSRRIVRLTVRFNFGMVCEKMKMESIDGQMEGVRRKCCALERTKGIMVC